MSCVYTGASVWITTEEAIVRGDLFQVDMMFVLNFTPASATTVFTLKQEEECDWIFRPRYFADIGRYFDRMPKGILVTPPDILHPRTAEVYECYKANVMAVNLPDLAASIWSST